MKKCNYSIIIISLLLVSKLAMSQIVVINSFSNQNIRYEDTWKASITNPFSIQEAYAELEITKNNQPLLNAITQRFDLIAGTSTLDFTKIKIEQIIYNTQNIQWNQFLTFGQYEVCLHIYTIEQQGHGVGCVPIDIIPFSPPVIISPNDEAEVGFNPIFSWSPPVPLNIFKNICYGLKIVPVYQGQSGYEAMSRNNPVLNEPCIASLSFIYNMTNLPLEDGVEYAWQITAKDENIEVGKSEVQTIKVNTNKEKPKEILIPDYYYKLRKTEDGNFGTAKGCLGFTCEEEKLDSNMKFKIYDNKSKEVAGIDKIKLKKVGDENYFILELASSVEFKVKETYHLEVWSPANKKYLLFFKYAEPVTK